jgi:hypothetical protein
MYEPNHEKLFLVIGRLEGKVDSLLSMLATTQDELKIHDERIRILEHSRGYIMGVSSLVGAFVGAACTLIVKLYN